MQEKVELYIRDGRIISEERWSYILEKVVLFLIKGGALHERKVKYERRWSYILKKVELYTVKGRVISEGRWSYKLRKVELYTEERWSNVLEKG